jgi:hypothetical protein
MANRVGEANEDVATEAGLIAQIASALEGKAAGGSGGGIQLPTLTNAGSASDLLNGKQLIDGNGNIVTGTIPSKSAATYTPTTSNQTITAGTYLSGTQTIQGDSNLVSENIKSGVSIFGVTGTMSNNSGGATIKTTTKKNSSNNNSIVFTGLTEEPKMFAISPTGNIILSSTKYVTSVMYDGEKTHGTYGYITSSLATSYYSASYFTWTYSNGTLTVKTSSTINGGNFSPSVTYQLTYVV